MTTVSRNLSALQKLSVIMTSLVLAVLAMLASLNTPIPMSYPDLVVGYLAWAAEDKLPDLLAALAFIAAAATCGSLIPRLLSRQSEVFGQPSSRELAEQMLWAALPAVVGFIGLLHTSSFDKKLLHFSGMALVFVLVAAALLLKRQISIPPRAVGVSVVTITLASLMPVELALFLGRLPGSVVDGAEFVRYARATNQLATICFLAGLFALVYRPRIWSRHLPFGLLVGQIGLSCVYLMLLPATLVEPSGRVSEYQSGIGLTVLVVALIVWGSVDSVIRFRRYRFNDNVVLLLSPIALFAALTGLKSGKTSVPFVGMDDYHFGELLLGGWLVGQGELPYVGHVLPHGFIEDGLVGLVSMLFFDGTAGSIPEAGRLTGVLLSLGAFLALRKFTGSLGLAFAAVLFLKGRLTWFFLVPFLCLWLSPRLRLEPSRWIPAWLITVPLVIVGAPPQGVPLAIATGGVALYMAWRLFDDQQPDGWRIWLPTATASAFLLTIGIATPGGAMLRGALEYVYLNGPINLSVYGVPWRTSWENGALKGVIFEVVRMSWVAVPIACALVVSSRTADAAMRRQTILTAFVISAFTLLLIPYSMGRIDAGIMSRPGLVAIFGWTVLLPILLWPIASAEGRMGLIVALTSTGAALISTPISLSTFIAAYGPTISTPELRDGGTVGLPHIGRAWVQGEQWERIQKLNRLINQRLAPRARYLDLTSRNANYFYTNRVPPVAVSAPYNMVSPIQQKDAIRSLKSNMPKLAILEASNISFDGGGLALRNPLIFRFVVENYEPEYVEGFIIGSVRNTVDNPQADVPVEVRLKRFSDANWEDGVHRWEAAFLVDNPYLLATIKEGSVLRLGDGTSRRVQRVWPEGSAVWTDTPLDKNKATKIPGFIKLALTADQYAEYRAVLFHAAFGQSNLQKIPVAWGRSAKSLETKMTLVHTISADPSVVTHLVNTGVAQYRVDGVDPSLIWDISDASASGRKAGILKFDFFCKHKAEEPRIQVFWWGDSHLVPFEASSIGFSAENGTMLVPLDASGRWLTVNQLRGIRIDLANPSACREIEVRNLGLYQRNLD